MHRKGDHTRRWTGRRLDRPICSRDASSPPMVSFLADPRSPDPARVGADDRGDDAEQPEDPARAARIGEVQAAVAQLPVRDRLVLQCFVAGRLDRETGRELGVSRSTVAHRRRRAKRTLHAMLAGSNSAEVPGVAWIQAAPFRSAREALQLAERIERDRLYLRVLLAFGVPGVRDLRKRRPMVESVIG